MSEKINSSNIDLVIRTNQAIRDEVSTQAISLRNDPNLMKAASMPQLALLLLKEHGLIQLPVNNPYWSGAIYVKEGKIIPVINTALPRANQYFAAWHEIYHLFFDNVSLDHIIENDNTLEERKAEYFAACMLLSGVERYFSELPEMDLISKTFYCMSAFQAPYKAVLIALYEYAVQVGLFSLQEQIKDILDLHPDHLPQRFQKLGLDDSVVLPSYVVNTTYLQEKIRWSEQSNPDQSYHSDNAVFLNNVLSEIRLTIGNRV